jgi:hypothetical protein
MSDVSALSVALLRRVSEFLDGLPEEHVADIAEGRARLTYIPWGAAEPVPPKVGRSTPVRRAADARKVDCDAIVAQLNQAGSRDEGRRLLDPLNVTALRATAKTAGMTGVSKTPKPELVEQLVALTIGGRLSYAAMRET